MKIISIRFKNLNSLVGEWEIDLNHTAYQNEGIFAITGPTGVGKSTILDAICLALYGRTPRLASISANQNEIMSRHTGECMAEVCFQNQKGCFRVYWYQHRAKQKAEGSLQAAKREISDYETGKILAHSIQQVQEKVVELTGMDFERFTRSMLLAQGSFAAFLQANNNERSALLEQINGTQIYSEISKKVFEIHKQHKEAYSSLENTIASYTLWSPDQYHEFMLEHDNKLQQQKHLLATVQQQQQVIQWRERILQLEDDSEKYKRLHQERIERLQQAQPVQVQLNRADKAQQLEADYALLQQHLESYQNSKNAMQSLQLQLDTLEQDKSKTHLLQQTQQQQLADFSEQHQQLLELIKQVRALDTQIIERENALHDEIQQFKLQEQQLKNVESELHSHKSRLQDLHSALAINTKQVDENQLLSRLVSDLPLLKDRILRNQLQADELHQKNQEFKRLRLAVQNQQEQIIVHNKNLEHAKEQEKLTHQHFNSLEQELNQVLGLRDLNSCVQESIELQKTMVELQQLEKDLEHYSGDHNLLEQHAKQIPQLEQAAKTQEKTKQLHAHTLAALQRHRDLLEKEYWLQQSIASLSELRAQLVDGQACALCGSLDHPYTREHLALPSETKNQLDLLQTEIKQCQEKFDQASLEVAQIEQSLQSLRVNLEKTKTSLADENLRLKPAILSHLPELEFSEESITQSSLIATVQQKIKRSNHLYQAIQVTISQAQSIESQLKQCQHQIIEAHQTVTQQQLATERFQAELLQNQTQLQRLDSEQTNLRSSYQLEKNSLLSELADLGLKEASIEQGPTDSSILVQLENKLETWKKLQTQQQELRTEISTLTASLDALERHQQQLLDQYQQRQLELQQKSDLLEIEKNKRIVLFAHKNTDQEETSSQQQLAQWQHQSEQTRHRLIQLTQHHENLEQQIQETAQLLDQLGTQDLELKQQFQTSLHALGFLSEQDYLEACLLPQQREQLRRQMEELKNEVQHMASLMTQTTDHLHQEQAKNLSTDHLETLRDNFQQMQEHLLQNQKELGALQEKLEHHRKQLRTVSDLHQQLQRQKIELEKWANLNLLIGSADGKNYRNFVQSITFEVLIQYANQQLQKISDRYCLIQSTDTPLELKVMDFYQANEIRSTQNLSGGETFLISLSLALGLSKMSSHQVSVDTLFLDEGFGTLDEDTLETALNTLASLQNEGKLIGLISHVAALKNRIATQIKVSPSPYGRSKIEGPGCSRRSSH